MAQAGLVDEDAERAFALAMRLRRRYENGHACPADLFRYLARQYRKSVAAYLGAADDWLNDHEPLRDVAARFLQEDVNADGASVAVPGVPGRPPENDCAHHGQPHVML